MRVSLIIPAYNEEATIFETVSSAKKYCDVIVIDDSSKDRTRDFAISAGAIVFTNEKNLGYDGSINRGFQEASKLFYTHVITFDADGQHPTAVLPLFFEKFNQGFDLALGTRQKNQRLGEYLFSLYTKYRFKLKDPLSGLKGYNLDFYKKIGAFDTFGSIGTELSLKSILLGAKYTEVPYIMNKRVAGEPKFGSSFKANLKILRALLHSVKLYK